MVEDLVTTMEIEQEKNQELHADSEPAGNPLSSGAGCSRSAWNGLGAVWIVVVLLATAAVGFACGYFVESRFADKCDDIHFLFSPGI